MLLTPLAFAPAQIRHRRFLPKAHHFEAKLTYLWFDPDQIEKNQNPVYSGRPLAGIF